MARFGDFPERRSDGRSLCKWCGEPVPKGRRFFCSKQHAYEVQIRRDSAFLRARTKERDHGVCAGCGIDTEQLKRVLRYTREALVYWMNARYEGNLYWFNRQMESILCGAVLWKEINERCAWQADHIVEVVDGGSPYMDNIQTLCTPCHKAKTKISHAVRAERRKAST